MTLANKLTIFRIILVLIMIIITCFNIPGDFLQIPIKFILLDLIFIIASITDQLDGYIARSRNQVTTFGKFLDPIADKILVAVSLIILVEINKIPGWILSIVIFREFLISGYRLVAVKNDGNVIAANIWGKTKTVIQMIAIIIAFIDINSFGACFTGNITGIWLAINIIETLLFIASVILTIFSGWTYLRQGKDILTSDM